MDLLETALKLIDRFGPAAPVIGLLFLLYWLERTERKEQTAQILTLTKEQIESEQQMTAAITLLTAKVTR